MNGAHVVQQILLGIWMNAPVWVWPLLVGLILLGLAASRPRRSPVFLNLAIPLLGLLSLNSIASLPRADIAFAFGVAGYAAGAVWAYGRQGRLITGVEGRYVLLRGEWITLACVMVIFWSNFAAGVVQSVAAQAYEGAVFSALFTICVAGAAGVFLGRSVRTYQEWRRA